MQKIATRFADEWCRGVTRRHFCLFQNHGGAGRSDMFVSPPRPCCRRCLPPGSAISSLFTSVDQPCAAISLSNLLGQSGRLCGHFASCGTNQLQRAHLCTGVASRTSNVSTPGQMISGCHPGCLPSAITNVRCDESTCCQNWSSAGKLPGHRLLRTAARRHGVDTARRGRRLATANDLQPSVQFNPPTRYAVLTAGGLTPSMRVAWGMSGR